jgi:YVTN family beta-propeller protein
VNLRGLTSAALALALLGAAPLPTVYTAPAGSRTAGAPNPARPYNVILPNGRIVSPVGKSVVVGMNALGVALSPDGKYAIVSNDDERDPGAQSSIVPQAHGGYSLAVVNTATMAVTDVYRGVHYDGAERFFLGIAALKDPAHPGQTLVLAAGGPDNQLNFMQLDSLGRLHESFAALRIPGGANPQNANADSAYPGWIALAPNHRVAYVVNNLANTVTAVDLRTRTVMHTAPVGYSPWAAAVAGKRLYVTDPGLMQYANLPQPVRVPQFTNVPFAPDSASALSTVPLAPNGDVAAQGIASTRMDVAPDGTENVGGAHPAAIAISKSGRYAYVCMTNVDRVAIVDLLGAPRVVGGLQLRLFDKAPYGTQPDAIVRSPDGKRLYVALAGMNAIAVLDSTNPAKLHRLGLIPTGWYPSALAVSRTGRYLFVANAKGIGQEPGSQGGSGAVWSTLQRIDMHKLPLQKTTMSALRYLRVAQRPVANAIVPPLRSLQRSAVIKHVVFIMEGSKTFDAMLGDLSAGDPSLASFANVTPNLHALARQYALATNLYADSEDSHAGHQYAAGGIATAYTEKTRRSENPDDYPRAGYIFNAAARAGLAYRDYGGLVRLSGYDAGIGDAASTAGLGGVYRLDVPALAALGGHIDLNYPGWNPSIADVRRAEEFTRDYTDLEQRGAVPDFTYIWLPAGDGTAEAADGDRALGTIVDFLTHQPTWNSTAIFITPDDAQNSRDHVNAHRTYAVVVSPYAKHRYIGAAHLSTVSVLKTEEELLGLPPLSLGDLLATDMSGFFQQAPDITPFTAIPVPAQTSGSQGQRP